MKQTINKDHPMISNRTNQEQIDRDLASSILKSKRKVEKDVSFILSLIKEGDKESIKNILNDLNDTTAKKEEEQKAKEEMRKYEKYLDFFVRGTLGFDAIFEMKEEKGEIGDEWLIYETVQKYALGLYTEDDVIGIASNADGYSDEEKKMIEDIACGLYKQDLEKLAEMYDKLNIYAILEGDGILKNISWTFSRPKSWREYTVTVFRSSCPAEMIISHKGKNIARTNLRSQTSLWLGDLEEDMRSDSPSEDTIQKIFSRPTCADNILESDLDQMFDLLDQVVFQGKPDMPK